MDHRGDDEPEYIDDDEFFDADALRRGSSNVLGGSGSRGRTNNANDANSARDDHPAGRSSGVPPEHRRARANRPAKKPRRGNIPPAKAWESGDKAASRRPANAPRGKPSENKGEGRDDQKRAAKRRFSRLRSPFQRDKTTAHAGTDVKKDATKDARPRDNNGKSSKLKAFSSRVGKLRQSLQGATADEDARPLQPVRTTQDQANKPSIRAAFGASRGDTRRPGSEIPAVGKSRGSLPRADAPERHARPSKAPIFKSSEWLDLDRKLDLIGVGLVFGAIVLFFSALSREQAAIGALHKLIGQLLGWGALAAPITMFAVGVWLIVRHFGDQAPMIDPLRLAGALCAFIGLLVLFQYGESLSYAGDSYCGPECVRGLVEQSYLGGRGGGLIGGWIYQVLVINLTELGGFVIVAMVLTFATMMITRLSMAELASVTIGLTRDLRDNMAQRAARRRARQLQMAEQSMLAQQQSSVRVSKPEAAKLSGAVAGMKALPEPSGATMPIPIRLRDMFSKRVSILRASDQSNAGIADREIVSASASERKGARIFGRFFGGGAASTTEASSQISATDSKAPTANKPQVRPNWRSSGNRPAPPSSVSSASSVSEEESSTAEPKRPQSTPFSSLSGLSGGAPAAPMERSFYEPVDDPVDKSIAEPVDEPAGAPPQKPRPASENVADDNARSDKNTWNKESAQVIRPKSGADEPPESFSQADVPDEQRNKPSGTVAESASEPSSPLPPAAELSDPENQPVSTRSARRTRPLADWQLPEFRALLTGGSTGEMDEEVLLQQAQIIEDTLASFGAPGRVVELNTGPVITQFGVEPDYLTAKSGKRSRIKVSAIAQLDKDLQLALGAKSIRIQAPVPGKGFVGIEVPNPDSAMVSLRDVMESRSFQHIDSPLAIALGMSVDGKPVSADLTQMPHLLIAGTTGSGKSKCINAIIISILANQSPEDVKFIMVDPKRVELTGYNGLPHLIAPVVVELEKTVGVLRWVTQEMDKRYKKFSQAGARNLIDYNHILDDESAPMPYIVVIIDELADLMMSAPEETERAISRIAALARATGIHLVIATQRPSVDVVTGLIKANFPARIAFAVAGSVDSRVILDQPGAERLLGKGDMLYLSGDAPAPVRMQGVFVSDEEINSISRYWKLQNLGIADIDAISPPAEAGSGNKKRSNGREAGAATIEAPNQASFWDSSAQSGMAVEGTDPQEDELYQTAVDMVRRLEKASISLLQRRLRIGYTRAARLVDMMEERGVVGPPKEGSSKPRDVLPE